MSETKDKTARLFAKPLDAIKFALIIAQDCNQDALEFLQCFVDRDADGIAAWDFDGTFKPERF